MYCVCMYVCVLGGLSIYHPSIYRSTYARVRVRTAEDTERGGERGQGVLRLEHVHEREAEGEHPILDLCVEDGDGYVWG